MPKLVTVLIDDETRHSGFFNELGENDSHIKTFKHHTYDLMVLNHKLKSLLLSSDGIIIMVNISNLTNTIINRIEEIAVQMCDKPIMIIVENMLHNDIKFDPCKLFDGISNDHRKAFMVDHTERMVHWVYEEPRMWFNKQLKTFQPMISLMNNPERTTSQTIKILNLVEKFETCSTPLDIWDHFTKLRLIHYSLLTYGHERTTNPKGWLCTHWKNHETSINHAHLWNYSITRFWITIISNIQRITKYKLFNDMYNKHLILHNGSLYLQYYSPDVIHSEHAKSAWIQPDLKKIE